MIQALVKSIFLVNVLNILLYAMLLLFCFVEEKR